MSHFPHIKYAGLSDVGRKRKNNEDSYGLFPEIGVFCVADGMGGGDDGEVADGQPKGYDRAREGGEAGDGPKNSARGKPAVRIIPKYASNTAEEYLYRALIRTYGEELAYLTMQEMYGW